jgi:hypothetical protein
MLPLKSVHRDQLEPDRPQVPGARRTVCLLNRSGDLTNLEALDSKKPQMVSETGVLFLLCPNSFVRKIPC